MAIVWALAGEQPVFQATNAGSDRAPSCPTTVTIDLGDNLHDPPINRVALTTQLRQLLKQHLEALLRDHLHCVSRCDRRHNGIIAATTDKSGSNPGRPQNRLGR